MNTLTAPNGDGYWGKILAIDAVSGDVPRILRTA